MFHTRHPNTLIDRSKFASSWNTRAGLYFLPMQGGCKIFLGPVRNLSKFQERIALSRVLDCGGHGLVCRYRWSMTKKEYEYRLNAIRSVELARRAASPGDKARLLKRAEAWLDLAKLTRSQSGHRIRNIGEHRRDQLALYHRGSGRGAAYDEL